MTIKSRAAIALACLLAAALAAPAVAAGASEEQEQTALMGTKLTLSEAITTAEHQTGGKAYDAGVDLDHGKPRVVVETNGPKGVERVTIDAQNGHVVGVRAGGEAD